MLGAVNHNATTTDKRIGVSQASKVWGEVPLPEDLEAEKRVQAAHSLLDDDEDFAADEASGDSPSGEDGGSAPWPAPVSNPSLEL
ncbi:hypothetical protein WMY93_031378 [Mugilogobius chulae]|uniref:Uncharacterized protein n=1 Tax=Mugilogobius chulae TaxID=88201 RepID=A0AAW0MML5_9GOBI